jgi:hypothetical protein
VKIWKNEEAASEEEETGSLPNQSKLTRNTKLTFKRQAVEAKA